MHSYTYIHLISQWSSLNMHEWKSFILHKSFSEVTFSSGGGGGGVNTLACTNTVACDQVSIEGHILEK